jgi:hypothetical protein
MLLAPSGTTELAEFWARMAVFGWKATTRGVRWA